MSMEFWVYLCTGLLMLVSAIHYGGIMGDANFKEKLVWGSVFGLLAAGFFVNAGFYAFAGKSFIEFF